MMRRISDRDIKRPHRVSVLNKGVEIGFFNMPATDNRFVKGDDLIQMALERALTVPTRRYNDDCLAGEWDELSVFWCWSQYRISRSGVRVYEAA